MDKNSEAEQYFAFWEQEMPIAAEHDHWVRWGKLMRAELINDNMPINLEIIGEVPRKLKRELPLDLELRFLFVKGSFYKDSEEFYGETNSPMAAESYIPCGTFSPTNDPDFIESPTVLMNGTVLSVEPAEFDGDKLFKIELRVNDYVFRVLSLDGFGELGIHEGNILSGFFHVLGKVSKKTMDKD